MRSNPSAILIKTSFLHRLACPQTLRGSLISGSLGKCQYPGLSSGIMFSKYRFFILLYRCETLQAQAEKHTKFGAFSFPKHLRGLDLGEHIIVLWWVPTASVPSEVLGRPFTAA